MGKKKKTQKKQYIKKESVNTIFDCVFCNNLKSVSVNM